MNAVKVVSIGFPKKIETQFGEKAKVSLTIRDISLTDPKNNIVASMFVPKEGIWFKEGDTILAEIAKTDKYINIKKVERFGDDKGEPIPPTPPIEPIVDTKPDWDAKDRRMVRMNVLSHATDIVNHVFMEQATDEKIEELLKIAEKLEKWVYRK